MASSTRIQSSLIARTHSFFSPQDKKDPVVREGGLLAFECLSDKLGKLFEPYVIHVLPMLLNCFGDPSPKVQNRGRGRARDECYSM